MLTTTQVAQDLKGLTFPCRKEECLSFLKERDVPTEVIDLFERMPQRRLDCMADVWSALGEVC